MLSAYITSDAADALVREADTIDVLHSSFAMPLKCFSLVRKVLDDTYNEIPDDDGNRDSKITSAIEDISQMYLNISTTGVGPNFLDPVNRFAYVYTYVPAHAHWVNELISWSEDAKEVFKKDQVRIACIGGGPGSDLVGILKYLVERGDESPSIFCEIADGCQLWKHTWADLALIVGKSISFSTDYIIHRVGDIDIWNVPVQFEKSDILTMNFFVSEIEPLGETAWDYLGAVFEKMKPGAILLFHDNNVTKYFGKFDEIARDKGLEILLHGKGDRRIYDSAEKSDDLLEYRMKFGKRMSKLKGSVAWRIMRKPVLS